MTQEQIALAAAAGLAIWFYGGPTLQKIKSFFPPKSDVVVPAQNYTLSDCLTQLRYFLSLQPHDARTAGLDAADIIDGIINEQPLLPSPEEDQ